MEPTQIILAGFGAGVSAKQLTEYLEKNVGTVWRCRLKTSWTPPSSFPKFTSRSNCLVENREKVPPHAFVHFAAPDAVEEAVRLASLRKLVFNNQALKIKDVIEFFVQHMVNDSLGVICNAHVVRADLSDCGALDEDCLKLAKLAAEAVDFPKTGKVAVMPHNLRPKQYPDFMDKEDSVSYRSEKVLGKLYRKVMDMFGEEVDEQKCCIDKVSASETLPYDIDLEVDGFQEYVQEAWEYKCSYDRQLQSLLGQFSVRKEGEVVTGHISSLTKYNSRRQGEIKKRLQHAYRALRKEFRLIFEGTINFQNLEPCERSKYEAKASAWYHVTYHTTWVQKTTEHLTEPDSCPSAPLLSFAWITVDYLAQIKLRKLCPSVDYSPAIRSILPPFMLVSHK